ncbi:hypothetical protein [Carboxylicivirga linearis]|uniref:DUF481 domain-containing protein n=1 Tax=Carboxylicivirga linearis TaxID=1628157 RepID=A0ABS5JYY3_9BACT|nr:hypothetical protein [Carboxylicivirga linearis]MBS2100113.1 hypothetical protein [Carboxylicivirga linearis]
MDFSPVFQLNLVELELSKPLVFNKANDTLNVFPTIQKESRRYIEELGLYHKQKVETFVTIGGYDWTNAEKTYELWDNTSATFGVGLLKTYSFMDPTSTQYQITSNLEITQPINNWLSAFANAQYVSNPVYKFNKNNGSLFYGNPLFMQTETMISIRAQYNNAKLDIGFRSIYGSQKQSFKPINMLNTKMTIDF